MITQNQNTSPPTSTSTSPPHLSATGTLQTHTHTPTHTHNPTSTRRPFPRPPRPAKIRQQKQTLHDDLTTMGFTFDEPLLHTRHSAALRYADTRQIMASQRADLAELPFSVEGWTPPPSAGLMRGVNENEVVGVREWDGSGRGSRSGMGMRMRMRRIEYIQTVEESRALRRWRRPLEEIERERFERLIGGGCRGWGVSGRL